MTQVPDHTAYCGIYCPDCMLHKPAFHAPALELRETLANAGMRNYAIVESPFGNQALGEYTSFLRVLDALCHMNCQVACRQGNGCSGTPCEIMRCCLEKGHEGCWKCGDLEACNKFTFLTPRCGDMPKANCSAIRDHGLKNWELRRKKFYVWL